MRLLYFGWVRTRIGIGSETLELPSGITDVRALMDWLKQRGDGYRMAFEDLTTIRVAINQEMATLDTSISSEDEVALFPPMTGG